METQEKENEIGEKLDAKARLKTAAIAMKGNAQIAAGAKNGEQPTPGFVEMEQVNKITEDWPATSKDAVNRTVSTYGPPNEAAPSRLIWYNNGPWKRTIVFRDEVYHHFPDPHTDVLQNFIDYKVPVDKISEIAKFDGSITVERTKGEVSSRCDLEAANVLALNMMHEIAQGNYTAEQAREKYSEQTAAYVMNRPAPYADKLQFKLPDEDTADPDEVTMGEDVLEQLKEKVKDVVEIEL